MNPMIWGLILAAILIVALLSWRPRRQQTVGSVFNADPMVGARIPAARILTERGLVCVTERTSDDASECFTLRVGEGEATLSLSFAPGFRQTGELSIGTGTLTTPGRAAGESFVRSVAAWLERPLPDPPGYSADLTPMTCSAAWLGRERGADDVVWSVLKVFLEVDLYYAEVFLRLSDDGKCAVLLEKDEDYREPLVAVLATALRDGPPPRRTSATDPNLESDEPLVRELRPLPGATEAGRVVAWGRSGLMMCDPGDHGRLLQWTDLSVEPRVLAEVDGVIEEIAASPDGRYVAVAVTSLVDGSEDELRVLILDVEGRASELAATDPGEAARTNGACTWSPDGSMLAVSVALLAESDGGCVQTRVLDIGSGREIACSVAALDAAPKWWNDRLILEAVEVDEDYNVRTRRYGWDPVGDPPQLIEEHGDLQSPGGTHRLRVADGEIRVVGPEGEALFRASWRSDLQAIADLQGLAPQWLGQRGLVLESDEPVVVDATSGRSRLLLSDKGAACLVGAAPDGSAVVIKRPDGLFWGAVGP